MDSHQRGFTLVEIMIAVACLAIVLAGGSALLAGMHPGALRNAVDDFDASLATARSIAASSGNGATIAVLPRTDSRGRAQSGFTLRVYSGRPTTTGAVQPANAFQVDGNAAISERTFGKPPFAIFLSSAGHPSGLASYPAISGSAVTFGVVASQPPCPAPGIVLTFTSPQGATDTRTLQCNASIAGGESPGASPTPNVPVVVPTALVAHWTSDVAALRFVAAEFGYTHWFASSTGSACGAVATYDAGWPYSAPQNPAESSQSPSPPAAPYSWPNNGGGSINDAPAPFRMSPVRGSPGRCAVDIVDAFGQHAGAAVQVMGDLTASPSTLAFNAPNAGAQAVTFSKTYDAENLTLMWGGSCGTLVTLAQTAGVTPSSAGPSPATAILSVAPKGTAGTCTLTVSDQYGEPLVTIPVLIKPVAAMNTWPEKIVMSTQVGPLAQRPTHAPFDAVAIVNELLGGAIANAATPMHGCLAQALMTDGVTIDPAPPQALALGIHIDPVSGCYIDTAGNPAQAEAVVYEPNGQTVTYNIVRSTCSSDLKLGPWLPASASGISAALHAQGVSSATSCQLTLTDGSSVVSAIDHGVVEAQISDGHAVFIYASGKNTCSHTGAGNPDTWIWSCDAPFSILINVPGNASCEYSGFLRSVNVGSSTPITASGTYDLGAQSLPADWLALFQKVLDFVESSTGYIANSGSTVTSGCP